MDFNIFLVPALLLLAMTATVVALAIYRFFVARQQEFHLHATAEEAPMSGDQVAVARRLDKVDRWGKLMTTLTFVYGMILVAAFFYVEFQKTGVPKY